MASPLFIDPVVSALRQTPRWQLSQLQPRHVRRDVGKDEEDEKAGWWQGDEAADGMGAGGAQDASVSTSTSPAQPVEPSGAGGAFGGAAQGASQPASAAGAAPAADAASAATAGAGAHTADSAFRTAAVLGTLTAFGAASIEAVGRGSGSAQSAAASQTASGSADGQQDSLAAAGNTDEETAAGGDGAGSSSGSGATGTETGGAAGENNEAPVAPNTSSSPAPVYPESAQQSVAVDRNLDLSFSRSLFTGSDASKAPAAIRIEGISENDDTQQQASALSLLKDGKPVALADGDIVMAEDFDKLQWDTTQNSGGSFSFTVIGTDNLPILQAGEQTVLIDESSKVKFPVAFFEALSDAFLGDGTMVPFVAIVGIDETESNTRPNDVLYRASDDSYLKAGDIIAAADYDNLYWDYSSNNGGTLHVNPLNENQVPYSPGYSTDVAMPAIKSLGLGAVTNFVVPPAGGIGLLIDGPDSWSLV